jgi:hypothetical protein
VKRIGGLLLAGQPVVVENRRKKAPSWGAFEIHGSWEMLCAVAPASGKVS